MRSECQGEVRISGLRTRGQQAGDVVVSNLYVRIRPGCHIEDVMVVTGYLKNGASL